MVAGPHLWVYNSIILKFLVWNQKKFFWAYLILSFGQGNPMMVRLMGPIKKTKQLSAETHLSCSPSTSTLLSSFCNILGYSSIRGWHQLGTYSSTIWPLSHPDMHRISKSFLLPVPSEAPACSPQGHQCSCYWGRGTPGWQSFFLSMFFCFFFYLDSWALARAASSAPAGHFGHGPVGEAAANFNFFAGHRERGVEESVVRSQGKLHLGDIIKNQKFCQSQTFGILTHNVDTSVCGILQKKTHLYQA